MAELIRQNISMVRSRVDGASFLQAQEIDTSRAEKAHSRPRNRQRTIVVLPLFMGCLVEWR